MKKILFIATGGTIASKQTENGLAPGFSAEDLLAEIPEVREICEFDCIQLCNLDSTNIYPKHWIYLSDVIRDSYGNYDGFIISHGTDTMAYTAAGLSYLIQNSLKPVILTGSQIPIGEDGSDAVKNLRDSFAAACDDRLKGVFVVFCGFVIAGTRVKKIKSQSFDSMYSMNFPNVAEIHGGCLEFNEEYLTPQNGETEFYNRLNPKVGVLKFVPGTKPDLLEYMLNVNDAVIVESYGVGGIPGTSEFDFFSVIEKAKDAGKFVIIATQSFLDGTDLGKYEVGRVLKENFDVIEIYDMTVESAYAKIMWILGRTSNKEEVTELFYTPVLYDININKQ